jgi:hypothetical protein
MRCTVWDFQGRKEHMYWLASVLISLVNPGDRAYLPVTNELPIAQLPYGICPMS